MAATIAIVWTPHGSESSTAQKVQYKQTTATTWTTHSTVSALASTVNITGLSNNTSYDVRIVNVCNEADYPSVVKTIVTPTT